MRDIWNTIQIDMKEIKDGELTIKTISPQAVIQGKGSHWNRNWRELITLLDFHLYGLDFRLTEVQSFSQVRTQVLQLAQTQNFYSVKTISVSPIKYMT